ncbi:hypothetical protein L228DRAFT_249624 [Xylona heveae TC161]|uniref:Uncharacterized protein n=1 Tax=Xylona heveae (strain CBS 132557 / TC161) TaxID=1328760 RepID=A0A165FC24_XYLHT|nr:hypothetical protein L228DRAFT_249624 [Xylona heveae TC161]KZF20807.1 hypothetical protein L228DRAFT_249624 [Xylona heveae TC161]
MLPETRVQVGRGDAIVWVSVPLRCCIIVSFGMVLLHGPTADIFKDNIRVVHALRDFAFVKPYFDLA